VLGIVASLLGVNRYLTANGLNLGALLGFALVMGFGGAIISLLMSKPMAKWSTGARVIANPSNSTELWLVNTVRALAERAGIPCHPLRTASVGSFVELMRRLERDQRWQPAA